MTKEIPFFERVQTERTEILSALKMQIRVYVDQEIDEGNEVSWHDFIAKYSEWNHEPLYEIIVQEIVKCMREDSNHGLSLLG
ncbi:hypothetical protein BBD42_12980 [Paenibacillus sp. BIHB 4019]|uniref:Uncharacterized protein n=1 Tax=Paenibacillus sp. BIHB 4019 TaxID=1870819 RepID=A0A1B2DHT4_9BACL|nr:hypothetical protein [Paenibacillus sp. BIHB 4019]ANY67284.1 hypothetical protein BBD42_12980 [Paenibacillus sp. BIHB 4019]